MMDLQEQTGRIQQAAARIVAARWHSIACMFGADVLRPAHSFAPESVEHEPYAPGFAPRDGDEFLASTTCEVVVGTETSVADAEKSIDLACYRLECQIRESMRSRVVPGTPTRTPPRISLGAGDRIEIVRLAGSPAGIRLRINWARASVLRVDVEALLRRVSAKACVDGAARRCVLTLSPVIDAVHEVNRSAPKPAQLLLDRMVRNGEPVAVLVAIGAPMVETLVDFGRSVARDIADHDDDIADG